MFKYIRLSWKTVFATIAIAILILAISFIFSGNVLADIAVITGSVVNVRSGPGTGYEISGNLYQNTEVNVLEISQGWYKISKGNLTGWVSQDLIKVKSQGKVKVIKELVNLRSGPSTDDQIVAKASKGDVLELLGTSGDWHKVRTASGQECYIAAYLTEKMGSSNTVVSPSSKQVQVKDGPINVRSGPSTSYSKAGMIEDKAIFTVLGEQDGWYKIQLNNGKSAWVAGWLVNEVQEKQNFSPNISPQSSNNIPSSGVPVVYLDGQKLYFEVEPIIENDRTLVPLRAIFEAMGAEVQWNNATRTVTAIKGGTTVILPVGSTQPTVNGTVWLLDVPAKIVQDRTLAPLRFVGEAFNGKVEWDGTTRTVTISSSDSNGSPDSGDSNETSAVSQPVKAVTVSESLVNLRSGPNTAYDKVGTATRGEILTVLAEQNGWYQVSRGGKIAWVASWVVTVDGEPGQDPVTKPKPEEPANPVIRPPVFGADEVWLSVQKDAEGIKLIMDSGSRIYADIDENGSNIRYRLAQKKIVNIEQYTDYYQSIGNEKALITARNESGSAVIQIKLPLGMEEYRTISEDGGKKEIFLIPNQIVRVSREIAGTTGDNIIIYTMTPCEYETSIEGETIEVKLLSTAMGVDRSEYKYSISPVLDKMTISQSGIEDPITTLKIETSNMADYSVFQTTDDNALNIVLTGKKKQVEHRENLVVIDAGHGGDDPGANRGNAREKDVNIKVALKVGQILESRGINVEYTRTGDQSVDEYARTDIANNLNAAVFVSIHCNSTVDNSTDVQGTETYYYAPIDKPELFWQKAERAELATCLQNELIHTLGRPNRGVKQKGYIVLNHTEMPSALVELAFINNSEERDLLLSGSFQMKAAAAIADGIENYIKR